MSAILELADPMTSDEFATTLLSESAAETPTPETEPASETVETTDKAESPTTASAEPATETPPAETQTPKPDEKPQWVIDLEAAQEARQRAEREAATLRGQVDNAAKQAAARARQEALAEAEQTSRQRTMQRLNELAASGQYTQESIAAERQRYLDEWGAEDRAKQEGQFHTQRAATMLETADVEMQRKEVALHRNAIPLIAEDFGLPVESVAAVWADEGERDRFRRAIGQTWMAQKVPGVGHNSAAAEDYLKTAATFFQREANIRQQHAEAIKAKDAQIADLTLQLNRDNAPDAPLEQAARSTGRRNLSPDDHATETLRGGEAILAAWLR